MMQEAMGLAGIRAPEYSIYELVKAFAEKLLSGF